MDDTNESEKGRIDNIFPKTHQIDKSSFANEYINPQGNDIIKKLENKGFKKEQIESEIISKSGKIYQEYLSLTREIR